MRSIVLVICRGVCLMGKKKSLSEMKRLEWKIRLISASIIVGFLILFFLLKMVIHYLKG